METREVTNQELLEAIEGLQRQVDHIREMIYETNMDFYDTMQVVNFNTYPPNIVPLTNRELILAALNMRPVVDKRTQRERLVPMDGNESYIDWKFRVDDEDEI